MTHNYIDLIGKRSDKGVVVVMDRQTYGHLRFVKGVWSICLLTSKKHHHGFQRIKNRIFRFHQEKKVWNTNCFHKIISIPRFGGLLCRTLEVSSVCVPGGCPCPINMWCWTCFFPYAITVASHNPNRLMQLKRQKLGKIQDMFYFQQWLLHCLKRESLFIPEKRWTFWIMSIWPEKQWLILASKNSNNYSKFGHLANYRDRINGCIHENAWNENACALQICWKVL